ncbi:PEP-utilizing enzyme [Mycobacterium arosiense]|uniref:PEP-utilising enzyme mobile domain-containing protein n=1 Tax=Mycobacterium arosiense ATCC BAA-1401 = DSM 45069 TaxID=1265311 RepID=A0A1W9Z6Y3_MYCAI|nr:PEP-utilizing enzyme [Mycobacterium arosiense]ORA08132.1 hypothetical protein BST14_24935 [Mycobacterium arosiense ATCC BAA-1401 = DSM 45069]
MTSDQPDRQVPAVDDFLNTRSRPTTFWTTVNAAEALPGTVTPLTWSLYRRVAELGTRGAFCDLGILRPSEICFPDIPDERFIGLFYGQCAVNVDRFRSIADRTPGQSGDSFEKQLFGSSRKRVASRPDRSRYGAITVKAPKAAITTARRLRVLHAEADAWWSRHCGLDGLNASSNPGQVFDEARDLFTRIMRPHVGGTMLGSGVALRLADLAESAGHPQLETRLLGGHGDMSETGVLRDLWQVSRGQKELDAFRTTYGYHGPNEGELLSRSWREDAAPLTSLLATYRDMGSDRDPDEVEARARRQAAEAEELLLASLGRARRPAAVLLLRAARHFVPLRELGRAAFLRAVDGARAAARAAGTELAAQGRLRSADDAFFLTAEELFQDMPVNAGELAVERRESYQRCLGVELPEAWQGNPTPMLREQDMCAAVSEVEGLAVSPGIVEGRVRVILSPGESDDLEPGEIVVCPFTDPGWASLFLVAGALVIDVGGVLSHGAIVARELGVPCVINTRVGTRIFSTGDQVRVDALAGKVTRLAVADPVTPTRAGKDSTT